MEAQNQYNDQVIYLNPGDTLENALSIFHDYQISHLPVVQTNKLVGLLSKTSVVDYLYEAMRRLGHQEFASVTEGALVSDIMDKPVVTIDVKTSTEDLLKTMLDNEVGSVVLTEKDRVAGIVTEHDIVRYFHDHLMDCEQKDMPMFAQISQWLYDRGLVRISSALGDIGI